MTARRFLRPAAAGLAGLAVGLTLSLAIRYPVLPLPGRPPRCPKCGYPTDVHPITYGPFVPPRAGENGPGYYPGLVRGRQVEIYPAGLNGREFYCTACRHPFGHQPPPPGAPPPTPPTAPPAPTIPPPGRSVD